MIFLVFLDIIQYFMNFIILRISFRFLFCFREKAEYGIRPLRLIKSIKKKRSYSNLKIKDKKI
jgi:hypothetical protein